MAKIVMVRIEAGKRTREIEVLSIPEEGQSVTVEFDNGRKVVVTPDAIQDLDGGGKNETFVQDVGTYQNVSAGRNAYVAGRDGNFNIPRDDA